MLLNITIKIIWYISLVCILILIVPAFKEVKEIKKQNWCEKDGEHMYIKRLDGGNTCIKRIKQYV